MIKTGPQIRGQLVPLSPRSLISWCQLRTFLVFISWATLSVSVCLAGTDSPYLLNFMSIITLCSRKHETSLRWAHNSRCFILSVLPSFFFLFLCLVTLWLSWIRYLFLESGLRLWAHSFILKWTSLRILMDEAPYLSPCVFLPLTHLKLQICSVRTCVGVRVRTALSSLNTA